MSRVIKSKYKLSRRLGTSVWGEERDAFHKKNYRPGQHGSSSMGKASDYGLHLRAKQLLKFHYGRITEKQFRNIFKMAQRIKGNTAEIFIQLLERRLDVIVYRLNIAPTIFAARQLVSHNHILVNGKKVNIASYRVNKDDVIEIAQSSQKMPIITESLNKMARKIPPYLSFNTNNMSSTLLHLPVISEVPYPFDPQVNLVIEFYSA